MEQGLLRVPEATLEAYSAAAARSPLEVQRRRRSRTARGTTRSPPAGLARHQRSRRGRRGSSHDVEPLGVRRRGRGVAARRHRLGGSRSGAAETIDRRPAAGAGARSSREAGRPGLPAGSPERAAEPGPGPVAAGPAASARPAAAGSVGSRGRVGCGAVGKGGEARRGGAAGGARGARSARRSPGARAAALPPLTWSVGSAGSSVAGAVRRRRAPMASSALRAVGLLGPRSPRISTSRDSRSRTNLRGWAGCDRGWRPRGRRPGSPGRRHRCGQGRDGNVQRVLERGALRRSAP